MDPTRSRRKISAGLSVGRAFHPIIAVNRFASFFFFLLFSPLSFSLSLSLSLPLAELSRIASRRYIRSRVKPAPLSLSLFPSFYFHRDPCQVDTSVYPLSIRPDGSWIARVSRITLYSFPSLGRNRRCSNSRDASPLFFLSFNLERYEVLRGSRLVKPPFVPLAASRNF